MYKLIQRTIRLAKFKLQWLCVRLVPLGEAHLLTVFQKLTTLLLTEHALWRAVLSLLSQSLLLSHVS